MTFPSIRNGGNSLSAGEDSDWPTLAQEMPASFIKKGWTKGPMCPCAIMNVLVQSRHESQKKTGLDEPIGTDGV